MVVTASRRQRLLETSQSLSIIKPSEWIGTNKTVADVVAEQTGVQTRRYGGTGSFQTVTIRGVQGNEVLVLLDGIPLNSAMGGAVDLGAISPDRIGEIEVYKGITPGEFGGNSLGGVINLKSKSSMKAQSLSAQTALGAYGYQKYSIETNHSFSDNSRIFGSLNYAKSDNNWPYFDRNKTPYNAADDEIRTVENHHYEFFEVRIHPSFDLPGGRTLASSVAYSTSETGIPASEGSTNRTAKHGQDLFVVTSRLSQEKASESANIVITPEIGYVKWSDNTFWTSLDESMGTPHGGIASAPNSYGESKSNLFIAHASCIADMFFADNLGGQVTLQGRHSQITTTTHVSGFPHGDWPGNSQELTLAGDVNGSLPTGRLSLGATIGGGIQAIRSATKGGQNAVLETTVLPSDTIEYPWSAHGGVQCRYEKMLNVFVNAARCSKIPGLRDKYGTNGAVVPNPDLTEESGITIEAGTRFLCERFFAEAVLFRTETRNGIVMLSDGNMTKPVNLAASVTTGLEASLRVQPWDFIRADFRVTLQNAENRTHLYTYYGKKLPNEPDLSGLGKITLGPFKGVEVGYWLDYKSFFFRDFGNTPGQRVPENKNDPGMLFHNAQITWKPTSHLDFGVSIRNFNGNSFRYEEMARSAESGYSWILYPANEWCFTARYSF
jgi:iron complex outermembrane receptor protein